MRTARLSALLLLSAVVAVPAMAGSGHSQLPSPIIGVQVMPTVNYTDAAGGGVATLANLDGGTSKGICCHQTGTCTDRNVFDTNALYYFSIYFDDTVQGSLQSYFLSLTMHLDIATLTLLNNAGVTFNLSGLALGESFNACIYVQFFEPVGFAGKTIPWGAGIVGPGGEFLQGQLGVVIGSGA